MRTLFFTGCLLFTLGYRLKAILSGTSVAGMSILSASTISLTISTIRVQLGPELDFLWTRTEKIRCESGMKVIDKQLLFVPNFGFILYPESIVNLYAGLELDYRVIYDRGIIFDIFSAEPTVSALAVISCHLENRILRP